MKGLLIFLIILFAVIAIASVCTWYYRNSHFMNASKGMAGLVVNPNKKDAANVGLNLLSAFAK